jgi:hypothetical protein
VWTRPRHAKANLAAVEARFEACLEAKFRQDAGSRAVLLATDGLRLLHYSRGKPLAPANPLMRVRATLLAEARPPAGAVVPIVVV